MKLSEIGLYLSVPVVLSRVKSLFQSIKSGLSPFSHAEKTTENTISRAKESILAQNTNTPSTTQMLYAGPGILPKWESMAVT